MPNTGLVVSPTSFTLVPHRAEDVTVELANSSSAAFIYKFKTTSPSRYVVKNRQGVVPPNGNARIPISIQKGFVVPNDMNDQFQVEYRALQPGEAEPADISAVLRAQKTDKMLLDCRLLTDNAVATSGAKAQPAAASRANSVESAFGTTPQAGKPASGAGSPGTSPQTRESAAADRSIETALAEQEAAQRRLDDARVERNSLQQQSQPQAAGSPATASPRQSASVNRVAVTKPASKLPYLIAVVGLVAAMWMYMQ